MHTLVLNLTRFGDLLQTEPVIAGLRDQGRSVALACLDNFAGATQFLPKTDHVFALPGAGLLADLDHGWPQGLQRLWQWREDVRTGRPSLSVLNLTPIQSARLLARFLTPKPIDGFGLDEQGFGYYSNSWAAFLQTSTMNRGCSPFNLVDLMLRSADLPILNRGLNLARPADDVLAHARNLLQSAVPPAVSNECRGFAALQLGASEPRRQWPQEYFAQLGDLLWEHFRLIPVLLGTSAERPLLEDYVRHVRGPFIDLVGRTSLPELAAVLCRADILITNDTGTMHLAAGLHRPLAAIFLATAQPWDTGPYQESCLCLEPNLSCHPCAFGSPCPNREQCRWAITPDQVFALIREHISLPVADLLPPSQLRCPGSRASFAESVRAWKTSRDEFGFLDLQALSGQEEALRTQWIRIQRHYYRQFLDQASEIHPLGHLPVLPETARNQIRTSLDQSAALLRILESQAHVLATAPLDKMKQKFMAYWERLQSHWQNDPFFPVLGRLWLTESQDQGRDMAGIIDLTQRYLKLVQAWQALFHRS